jgi:hypothetical protein
MRPAASALELEEVDSMAFRPGRHMARPQALESITIPLIPAVAGDLQRLQERTNLSAIDLANRAITSYEFFDAQLQSGHDLIVRDRKTGKAQLVHFLLRLFQDKQTCRPRPSPGGAGRKEGGGAHAPDGTKLIPRLACPASHHHRQDLLPLAGPKARKREHQMCTSRRNSPRRSGKLADPAARGSPGCRYPSAQVTEVKQAVGEERPQS